MMSAIKDSGKDTLLDRLNNIVEEGEEDDDSIYDNDSIEPGEFFDPVPEQDEDDSFEDDDGPDEYDDIVTTIESQHKSQTSRDDVSDCASYTSDFNFSGLSFDGFSNPGSQGNEMTSVGTSSDESGRLPSSKGGSFSSRRLSGSRISFNSAQSAPQSSRRLSPVPPTRGTAQRRVTISAPVLNPSADDEFPDFLPSMRVSRQVSRRRHSIRANNPNTSSVVTDGSSKEEEESTTSNSQSNASSRLSVASRFLSYKGNRRTSYNSAGKSNHDSLNSAFSSVGIRGNTEWENVAAAAAIVAASSVSTKKRSNTQFKVGDKALAFLNVLNHTNSVDDREDFSINPVNKFGYPRGEGKLPFEQQEPYVYVLVTVKKVHFDEDLRYFTVERADTKSEQRADAAWMEPIKSLIGIEAATRAAEHTSRTHVPLPTKTHEEKRIAFQTLFMWPVKAFEEYVLPFSQVARKKIKEQVILILLGKHPYACELRATSVNILVLCSSTYLFLDSLSLAFFPPSSDFAVAVIEVTVWSILAAELILEWAIRPSDYSTLIHSEKAFAPSTARNINGFHLFFEALSLAVFIPNFICLSQNSCSNSLPFSGLWASIRAVTGPTTWDACLGRLIVGLRALRMFSMVRHWKKMRINNTFREGVNKNNLLSILRVDTNSHRITPLKKRKGASDEDHLSEENVSSKKDLEISSEEEDQRLKKAATIGTSLMVVNSHRALTLLSFVLIIVPMISSIYNVNRVADKLTNLLHENAIVAVDCEHLQQSLDAWLRSASLVLSSSTLGTRKEFLLWAQILPSPRGCEFLLETNGVITRCNSSFGQNLTTCSIWNDDDPQDPANATPKYFAEKLGLREGGIQEYSRKYKGHFSGDFTDSNADPFSGESTFTVRTLFNQNELVSFLNLSTFLLLLTSLMLCLIGLASLNGDAQRLVLDPLRRMLKIVVRYAENPLSQTPDQKSRYKRDSVRGEDDSDGDKQKGAKDQLGNYETEQLINAISKIADLLRKCWGVAGAGIISSNLARTQDGKTVVFNPTVPGKQVYALFGFVTINGFSDQLRALDRDVMILINDVAAVVHDEVFRWALGDSGQCNKNLGSSFLMVFRIGDFKEVHEKQARATDVVFSANDKRAKKLNNLRRRRHALAKQHGKHVSTRFKVTKGELAGDVNTIQLASLPGIQTFSDRALLGLLKSFAGILRDKELAKWKRDFRLGAGVGAYVVNIIIGMDAGWAVEGAVGSEYKIDATYLSPHVNMASRMMSAAKQYGVTILLSQAVEALLSIPARNKLRHLDTVYVKGSSVSQRIFTYDARQSGVDFFLFERSPEQADLDAESYHPAIWDTDQDLCAMRNHVTEDFLRKFNEGRNLYLAGEWMEAVEALKEADEIMTTTILEEGYLDFFEDDMKRQGVDDARRLRGDLGDGPSKCLIAYMEKRNSVAPENWMGVRPLTSK